ncbi:CorA metal ion transporter [Coemansia sp. RSA 2599]|nr:CorA metal ion transporter [Coemansia sp. RSA 2599]
MRPLGTSAGISQRILSGAADGPRQRRRSSRWIQSIAATGTSMAAASEGDGYGYGVSLLSSQGFGDDSSLSRDERHKASIVDMDAGLSDPTSVASKPRKADTSGKVAIERGDMHESSVLWMHSAYCEKEQRQQQPTQAPRGSAFMSGETSDKGRAKSSILQGAGSAGSSDFADKSRYMFYSSQTDAVFSSSLVKPAYGDLGIDALIDMVLESGANQAGDGSGVRGACFWLDIAGASAQEVADLSDIFELHPLSTQDIVSGCPRDKIDVFGNYAFIVYSSMLHGAGSGRLSSDYGKSSGSSDIAQWTGEPMHWHQANKCPGRSCRSGAGGSQMCIVMRGNYVVTFHCGHQRPVVRRVLDRLDAMKRAALAVDAGDGDADGNGGIEPMPPYTKEVPLSGLVDFPAYVVYAILDEITDQLSPEMLAIEQHVDAIDELVLVLSHNEHENMLQRMGEQRRRILTTWQVVQPKAEIVDALAQLLRTRLWTGSDELAEEVAQYLGDVHAHLAAAVGTCTRAEAVLSRSHANYLAKISLELSRATFDSNSTTERWTMLGTIVVPINIVTSFLGVNLKVPGQDRDDTLNFFIVMACMVVYAAATLAFWRWRRII